MNSTNAKTAGTINVILGIWLIISPFVFGASNVSAILWNDIIFGIIIALLAYNRTVNPQITWPSWVNFLLGIWLIIAPYVLNFGDMASARTDSIVVGIVVGLVALWSALSHPTVVTR